MRHQQRQATAVALALAASAFWVSAPPLLTSAFADNGSLVIHQRNNEGATYDAYLLFLADVTDTDVASHLTWSSKAMKGIVLDFLDTQGYGEWLDGHDHARELHDRAQLAAEFITERIKDSPTAEGSASTPRTTDAGSFAHQLARALATHDASPRQTAREGQAFTGPEGYYLFLTSAGTTGSEDEAASAPLWIALGGSVSEVYEKTSVPTIVKQVREDATGTWGLAADAHRGQHVRYRLTATLPENVMAFSKYHLRFEDTLSRGLELVVPAGASLDKALSLSIGGTDVDLTKGGVTLAFDEGRLVVDIADLRDARWRDAGVAAGAQVVLEYDACLGTDALAGAVGHPNTARLVYTDNPISLGDGRTSTAPPPRLYTFELLVTKRDEQTSEPLGGAAFTLRVADDSSDEPSRGLYVQQDGSLAETPHEFETGDDGTLLASGLDEGSYVLEELRPPTGYEAMDRPIGLRLDSTYDTQGALQAIDAELSGGDTAEDDALAPTEVTGVDVSAGRISLTASDDRFIELPLTGRDGIAVPGITVAAVAVGAGVGSVLRRRKGE